MVYIYIYVCMHHIFFVHPSVDGHFCYFHIFTTVNNASMNMRVQVSLQDIERDIPFPLDIYPEVRLMDHKVVLFLIF